MISLYINIVSSEVNSGEFDLTGTEHFKCLINAEDIETQGLFLAAYLCWLGNSGDYYDTVKSSKKLIKSAPKNLDIYIHSLNLAVAKNDEKQLEKLIKNTSKASAVTASTTIL